MSAYLKKYLKHDSLFDSGELEFYFLNGVTKIKGTMINDHLLWGALPTTISPWLYEMDSILRDLILMSQRKK